MDSANAAKTRERRRGTDRRADTPQAKWQMFRRYLRMGSIVGNVSFVLGGLSIAWYYGGFGGMQFFSKMWLIDQTGNFAVLIGAVFGIIIALICVWSLNIIFWAFISILAYWYQYKELPLSQS